MSSLVLSALAPLTVLVAPAPSFAAPPVRALVSKPLSSIPDGAGALRLSIYGDNSQGMLQPRLLAPGQDGVLSGYYAGPVIPIDFEGWKTVTIPLSDFTYRSDTSPGTTRDGMEGGAMQPAALQLALIGTSTRLFLTNIGWTAAGASETDPLLGAIDTTDMASARKWRAVGDFDQIRSLSIGVNKLAQFNQGDQQSLQLIVRNNALNDQQLYRPGATAQVRKTPGLPYVLYSRAPFDPIYPESTPSTSEIKTGVALTIPVCADETEPASLAVYAGANLTNATIKIVGPFATATRQILPDSALNIRVVRPSPVLNGPKLLMKDDRESLSGISPQVRLTGNPATDIPAGTSKQFWVTVTVPRNQTPGMYKGKLVFSAQGGKPKTIPIAINVLPLPLKTAFLQYGMDPRSLLSAGEPVPGALALSEQQFAAQIKNIGAHGFGMVMLHETGSDLQTQARIYKEAQLSKVGPIVLTQADPTQDEGLRQAVGLTGGFNIYYQLPDSLLASGAGGFTESVRNASSTALVVASVESATTYSGLSSAMGDSTGDKLAPIYPVSSDYSQKMLSGARRTTPNRDYWTWNIPLQSAIRNRLLAGFLLYKSGPGFYGAFAGPYFYVPEGTDPYAAFTASPATAPENLPQMTAFPVAGGVLDTLQWEGVREGIDDIRYIGVLKAYVRELKDAKRRKDATDYAESFLLGMMDKPLVELTADQIELYRRALIRESLKLKAALSPGAASRPGK